MNILITILAIVLAVVVMLLVVGLFTIKEYHIEKQTVINKPKQEVFDFINLVRNQTRFNKWWMMDPNAKIEYRGNDGSVGFIAAWDSNNKNVGKGEQEVSKITDGERIDYEIRFEKPIKGISLAYLETGMIAPNQTKVSWGFNSGMKYPMNIILLFINLPKVLGDDIQKSLDTLKSTLEK